MAEAILAPRLRLVTINSHQPYVHLLAGLPHELTVIDRGLEGGACGWDPRVRPLPDACRLAALAEARALAGARPFDVGIAHNVSDLLALRGLCDRRVLVIHVTLSGWMASEGCPVPPRAFIDLLRAYLRRAPALVVFVSPLKRLDWTGLPGVVQTPGVPEDVYSGYTGEQPVVLRVAHDLRRRAPQLRPALQEAALRGVPQLLLGHNAGTPAARPARDWDHLRAAYRTHRCLLVTNHPTREDGHNLAVIEAMMTGMPIVTTPHPTSPVRHGREGLVGRDAAELRAHLARLLHDPELARRLGAQARATAGARYPYAAFLDAWDRRLRRVAAAPPRQLAADAAAETWRALAAAAGADAASLRVLQGGAVRLCRGRRAEPALRAIAGGRGATPGAQEQA